MVLVRVSHATIKAFFGRHPRGAALSVLDSVKCHPAPIKAILYKLFG